MTKKWPLEGIQSIVLYINLRKLFPSSTVWRVLPSPWLFPFLLCTPALLAHAATKSIRVLTHSLEFGQHVWRDQETLTQLSLDIFWGGGDKWHLQLTLFNTLSWQKKNFTQQFLKRKYKDINQRWTSCTWTYNH